NLRLHVGELFLNQLVGGKGPSELLALEYVRSRAMPAVLCCTQRAPGNPVTCTVETGERPLQSPDVGKRVLVGAEHVVHDDFACDARTQADLAMDWGRGQPFPPLLQNKTANRLVIVLGPYDEHVRDRTVGDPRLRPGEHVAA